MGPFKRFVGGIILGTILAFGTLGEPLAGEDTQVLGETSEYFPASTVDSFSHILLLMLGLFLAGFGVWGTFNAKRTLPTSIISLDDFRRRRLRKNCMRREK